MVTSSPTGTRPPAPLAARNAAADVDQRVGAPLRQRPCRHRTAGRVGWAREIERCEQGRGAFGVEVTVEDAHPVQRGVDVEVAAFVDRAWRRGWRARRRRCCATRRANPAKSSTRHRLRRVSTRTASLRAYSGSRWRTIGASTSTCRARHVTGGQRLPGALRARGSAGPCPPTATPPTARSAPGAPTTTAGSTPRRAPNPPAASQSRDRTHDLGLEALRDLEQLDQLIRPVPRRPLPPVLGCRVP